MCEYDAIGASHDRGSTHQLGHRDALVDPTDPPGRADRQKVR